MSIPLAVWGESGFICGSFAVSAVILGKTLTTLSYLHCKH